MGQFNLDDNQHDFMLSLYQQTQGNTSIQVSMYEIGSALQLEKETITHQTEFLIGLGLVEIKTLSGGIGITENGAEYAMAHGAGASMGDFASEKLGTDRILRDGKQRLIEAFVEAIRHSVSQSELAVGNQAEIDADIRTIETQMTSPNPKTSIIRCCFESLAMQLEQTSQEPVLTQIQRFLD